jgi:DNA-nicking Smr family endonuclease
MNKEKEQPAPPDAELFRQALDGVVPLAQPNHAPSFPQTRRAPVHSINPLPVADTLSDHGAGDESLTEFLRPGISRMVLRKLRRGKLSIQDTLDLHGLNSDEARKLLLEFLRNAMKHNLHQVCVIHGKGRQARSGEGVLKIRTRHWLTQCTEVLAFCETPPKAGGSGAVWVLLKSGHSS